MRIVEHSRHEPNEFGGETFIPAVGKCDCGALVELDGFTNTCDRCGADYNSGGQRLAPRQQWGEETGEHWTECY